jgi:hypothetical protein
MPRREKNPVWQSFIMRHLPQQPAQRRLKGVLSGITGKEECVVRLAQWFMLSRLKLTLWAHGTNSHLRLYKLRCSCQQKLPSMIWLKLCI